MKAPFLPSVSYRTNPHMPFLKNSETEGEKCEEEERALGTSAPIHQNKAQEEEEDNFFSI